MCDIIIIQQNKPKTSVPILGNLKYNYLCPTKQL